MMALASLFLGNEWARLGMVAVFCFGFGWVRGFDAVPRADIIAARDAHWKIEIQNENEVNEKRIADAITAGQSVTIDVSLERLCKKEPFCRDK